MHIIGFSFARQYDDFQIDPCLTPPLRLPISSEHPHQRPSCLDLAVFADGDEHFLTMTDPSPQAGGLSLGPGP